MAISGGVAGNVIPDGCTVSVNYRFAPDRGVVEAEAHMREVFEGFDLVVSDSAPGALPGLDRPAAAAFLQAVGGSANPKFGWTDVVAVQRAGHPGGQLRSRQPELAHTQARVRARSRNCIRAWSR